MKVASWPHLGKTKLIEVSIGGQSFLLFVELLVIEKTNVEDHPSKNLAQISKKLSTISTPNLVINKCNISSIPIFN